MKAWEVLKALDEGKVVQRSLMVHPPCGEEFEWRDVNPEHVKDWLVYCVDLYPVRIKPEPRKVWIGESPSGVLYSSTQDFSEKDKNWLLKIHGPFELKD